MGISWSRYDARHPTLYKREEAWVDDQPFLLSQGYMLRPRYNPRWKTVYRWTWSQDVEHTIPNTQANALDAVHLNSNQKVVLKRVHNPEEIRIHAYLHSLRSDSRNRTIPVLRTLDAPNSPYSFIVTPYCRVFDHPPFHCRMEFIEAMSQYLEGLEFMHECGIAHLDIAAQNMVVDEQPIVPLGSHFCRPQTHTGSYALFQWENRCSAGQLNYYYIDFGLAEYYPEGRQHATRTGTFRTFPDIPEVSADVPYNPFLVDIFQLGLVMHKLIYVYSDLEPFRPVAAAMTASNPSSRPSPATSLRELRTLAGTFTKEELERQIWDRAATPQLKADRTQRGGYVKDYLYVRHTALYGEQSLKFPPPPASTWMAPAAPPDQSPTNREHQASSG
ncbi:Protein kinase domain-containing protein [Mycena kentingensis (nom. inval.)]|nr:Protein kinase domain-containing protein [Mycena kentingensis (nom. inval.)]